MHDNELEITKNEVEILLTLRSLQPFEKIEVHADKTGKPDTFLVIRSYKKILANDE